MKNGKETPCEAEGRREVETSKRAMKKDFPRCLLIATFSVFAER